MASRRAAATLILAMAFTACGSEPEMVTEVSGALGSRVFQHPYAIYTKADGLFDWDDKAVIVLISDEPDACRHLHQPFLGRSEVVDDDGKTVPSLVLEMEEMSSFETDKRVVGSEKHPLRATFDPGGRCTKDDSFLSGADDELPQAYRGEALLERTDDAGSDSVAQGTFKTDFGELGDACGSFRAEYCSQLEGSGCSSVGGGLATGVLPLLIGALGLRRRGRRAA